jgi:hypothetical protein
MDKPYYEDIALFSQFIQESLEQGAKKMHDKAEPMEERPYCD